MNKDINDYIENLFKDIRHTPETLELKDEMIQDLTEKFNDLVAGGMDQKAAFEEVINGVGDIKSLINEINGGKDGEVTTGVNSQGYDIPKGDDIRSLRIEWVSGEIDVLGYDGDTIQIDESSWRPLPESERLVHYQQGNELVIKFSQKILYFFMPSKRLTVRIPRRIAENMLSVNIVSVSAKINAYDFNSQRAEIKTTSGRISVRGVDSSDLKLSTVSGVLRLENISSNYLKLASTSGSVEIQNCAAGILKSEVVSGSTLLNGSFNELEISSTSGRVEIADSVVPSRLMAKTVSSGIRLTIPRADCVRVRFDTVSGRIDSSIGIINTRENPQFYIKTVSGSLFINALN